MLRANSPAGRLALQALVLDGVSVPNQLYPAVLSGLLQLTRLTLKSNGFGEAGQWQGTLAEAPRLHAIARAAWPTTPRRHCCHCLRDNVIDSVRAGCAPRPRPIY
jgi:hypothetical protein